MSELQNSCILSASEMYDSFNHPMLPLGDGIIHVVV